MDINFNGIRRGRRQLSGWEEISRRIKAKSRGIINSSYHSLDDKVSSFSINKDASSRTFLAFGTSRFATSNISIELVSLANLLHKTHAITTTTRVKRLKRIGRGQRVEGFRKKQRNGRTVKMTTDAKSEIVEEKREIVSKVVSK